MNDYERIADILRFLDEYHLEQPDLDTLAEHAGLSKYHFHRLFSRWAGITPKSFLQCLTLAHARKMLQAGKSVLATTLDAGLSGPSRLHDLCVGLESASPGEIKSGGAGWTLKVGFADSPFGTCLVAESPRGICHLSFVPSTDQQLAAVEIQRNWPQARLEWDNAVASQVSDVVFQNSSPASLRAYVRGTEFQVSVWRALLHIPNGTLVSYGDIASNLGNRGASRAVGAAVGQNALAYLIPCHRVIRETGVLGDYRWDATRKKAMLAWETAERVTGE
jgi:AraC family transcriptional regulator of adaptative response/methylated-DNA-[protein]-cysteine methyltransferase